MVAIINSADMPWHVQEDEHMTENGYAHGETVFRYVNIVSLYLWHSSETYLNQDTA